MMYKVKFKIAPNYIQYLFFVNHTVYNLRVKEFNVPRFNTVTYGKHSLRYLGPVLWATLPAKIRTSNSLHVLRESLGDWIWRNYWMVVAVRDALFVMNYERGAW